MADGVFDDKMKQNPYAPWGWDYVGNGEITGDLDMNGHKIVNLGDPQDDSDAVTKKYVDDAVAAGGGGGGGPTTARLVQLTPTGNIQATNVQDAFAEMAQEAAIKDEANVFTQKQTIGGADIEEVVAAVPYGATGMYATGKVTNISSQNPVNFETPDITMNGDRVPAALIGYTAKPGGLVQGVNVQDAITSLDALVEGVQGDFVAKSGLTADLSAATHKITDLGDGAAPGDAVNFGQLDAKVDKTDFATLEGKVTANTSEIDKIKDGTTPIDSSNVTFAPAAGGTLDGQDNVQKALTQVDTLMKGVQTSITDLKNADKTFVTKAGGVLESNLNAAGHTVTGLGAPGGDTDAANRKYVDDQIGAIQGSLSGQLQWAGTYDCTSSTIQSLSDVAVASGHFTTGSNVPVASAAINNFYFIVTNKAPATPKAPAPQKALSAGDWIIGDTSKWDAIELAKTVTATNVDFTPTGSLSSSNVQAAIAELDTDLVATTKKIDDLTAGNPMLGADKIAYTEKTPGVIAGNTVQDALVATDGLVAAAQAKITANENSITALQTAMNDVAKLNAANVFAEANTFNKVPTIAAGQVPAQPTDIATVKTVTDKIADITAAVVSYDNTTSGLAATTVQQGIDKVSDAQNIKFKSTTQMTQTTVSTAIDHLNSEVKQIQSGTVTAADVKMAPAVTNLPGATVQEALSSASDFVGRLNDYLAANSTLVGTYNAATNQVVETFGLAATGNVVAGSALPIPDDVNKMFLLVVTVSGTQAGPAPAPTEVLKSGDFVYSRGAGANWERIEASVVHTASDIPITAIAGVTGTNVQEALQDLHSQHVNIKASKVGVDAIQGLTGNTVQEMLVSAKTLIDGNTQGVSQLENSLQSLDASGVRFDNTTVQLAKGANVQEAIVSLNDKITTATGNITASTVPITAIAEIPNATNVQEALQGVATKVVTAASVTFAPTGAIAANNVQDALAEVDSETVKLTGAQTITGGKVFGDRTYFSNAADGDSVTLQTISAADPRALLSWRKPDGSRVAYAGFQSATPAQKNTLQFHIDAAGDAASPTRFQFTKPVEYSTNMVPATDTQLTPKKYVDDQITAASNTAANAYLPKNNGVLGTNLDANNKKITNLGTPTDATDSATKGYVDNGFVKLSTNQNIGGEKTFDDQAHFVQGLDMMQSKITDLAQGDQDGDAVNKAQLDAAIRGVQGQLTGKLTYCGTYDAGTNKIASVSSAGAPSFTVGQPLPADAPGIANCFLIVTVAGNPVAPLPTGQRLGVGDIVLAQGGSGWLIVPIGSTRTASNVSVTAIQQLPNATNVQQALEQLAVKPAGASTAAQLAFTPVGEVAATNVQAAIAELDSETVKTQGRQDVYGRKQFRGGINLYGYSAISYEIDPGQTSFMEWFKVSAPKGAYARLGFGSSQVGQRNIFEFYLNETFLVPGDVAKFQFTHIASYRNATIQPTEDTHLTPKKYVDDQITSAGSNYVAKVGGQLGGPLNANSQKITNLDSPAAAGDAVNRSYMEAQCVLLGSSVQTVQGLKTFNSIRINSAEGFAFLKNVGDESFFQWRVASDVSWYCRVGFRTANPTAFAFINNATKAGSPAPSFTFNRVAGYDSASIQPTENTHFATKKYVDDKVAAGGGGGGGPTGLEVLAATDVDVTANFAGLTGKGTALWSHRLLKDTQGNSILSALFGLKLTLTAAWTPTASNTPTQLVQAAHIPGTTYYNALPVPPDTTLGNDYKTVAQIHLYRVVPKGGVPLIQADAPIKIGRIVALFDTTGSGWTKLYVVFSSSTAVPIPGGAGAYYVMRYEGLPGIPL